MTERKPAFTETRLSLEERAKKEILKILEAYTYKIKRNDIPEVFSFTKLKDEDKPKMAKFLGDKFDLFASKLETNEYYLVETKGKSKAAWKTWVNKVDYNGYYEIASIPFPFLYLVWIEETRKTYIHTITNPKDFTETTDQDGKPIYYIPENQIHEILPAQDIPIRLWIVEE